jgi:hypothetical protein
VLTCNLDNDSDAGAAENDGAVAASLREKLIKTVSR